MCQALNYYHFVRHYGTFSGLTGGICGLKCISAHRTAPPPHHNRVTDQTVLLSLFPLLFFLSALQSNNKSNTVYVCGHDCVLGPYQSHFNPCLAAGA